MTKRTLNGSPKLNAIRFFMDNDKPNRKRCRDKIEKFDFNQSLTYFKDLAKQLCSDTINGQYVSN